ncbi:MAG: NAD(P)H-dependent glycerol-3-phosphate dehydrogenase [Hyphomicrobiaceae bacterium]
MTAIRTIGVIGAGAWGTALAQTARLAGCDVAIWAREAEVADEINSAHRNSIFLPDVALDPGIVATSDLAEIAERDAILLVPPAQHVRATVEALAPLLVPKTPVVVCAKGLEQATGKLMGDVLSEALPGATPAFLSGPSFAADVARGLPAALTLAIPESELGQRLAEAIGYRNFRLYWSDDLIGVQLGGALKNVLAIAAGIVDGKALGASAHAALVTRGFAEMSRLGITIGARQETLAGLSGLGDLVLTCGSPQSRNMSLGRALGQGQKLADVLGSRRSVAEGVYTAAAVVRVAGKHGIEMPIASAVDAIVTGALDVDTAIETLLARPFRPEGI